MYKTLIAAAVSLMIAGCGPTDAPKTLEPAAPAPVAMPEPAPAPPAVTMASPAEAFAAKLDATLMGAHRNDANKARDGFRHPKESLNFFGFGPGMTVVEITPGGGWYSEILAPTLKGEGTYVAAIIDPATVESEGSRNYYTKSNTSFREKLAGDAALYDATQVVEFNPSAPMFGPDASADLVLTFRNVHNWVGSNSVQPMFDGFFKVLKPGGVLGVVEHRAMADDTRDIKELAETGYFPEALVIEHATKAGFQLVEKSEINANPADTKDHPNGVWTLPPSLQMENVPEADHAKYKAIGESDRMTLKFIKPATPTAG